MQGHLIKRGDQLDPERVSRVKEKHTPMMAGFCRQNGYTETCVLSGVHPRRGIAELTSDDDALKKKTRIVGRSPTRKGSRGATLSPAFLQHALLTTGEPALLAATSSPLGHRPRVGSSGLSQDLTTEHLAAAGTNGTSQQ